jgi:hypothetical protein
MADALGMSRRGVTYLLEDLEQLGFLANEPGRTRFSGTRKRTLNVAAILDAQKRRCPDAQPSIAHLNAQPCIPDAQSCITNAQPCTANAQPSIAHNLSDLSDHNHPEPATGKTEPTDEELLPHLKDVFAYYLDKIGRNPKTYALDETRVAMGLERFRECLAIAKDGAVANAQGLMKCCIDAMVASDWHMGRDEKTKGAKYCDWQHLFRSHRKMEYWWNK